MSRYEIKLVFDGQRLAEARSWVLAQAEAFQVAYPPRQVNNIYFDTYHYDLLQQHIDGVAQRSKLRYRWYGASWQIQSGHLEVKRKSGRLGDKISYSLPAKLDLENQPWDVLLDILKSGLPEEGAFLLDGMQPVLINQYQREYYASMDGKLRITLDFGVRAFSQAFGFVPNIHFPQPLRDDAVLELKAAQEVHPRVVAVLSAFPLYAQQNSKYLNGMALAF